MVEPEGVFTGTNAYDDNYIFKGVKDFYDHLYTDESAFAKYKDYLGTVDIKDNCIIINVHCSASGNIDFNVVLLSEMHPLFNMSLLIKSSQKTRSQKTHQLRNLRAAILRNLEL